MVNQLAVEAMKSRTRAILVTDLKAVCKDLQLTVSGTKIALQQRIVARIDVMVAQNNITGLNALRSALIKSGGGSIPLLQVTTATPTTTTQRYGSSSSPYMNGAGSMQRNGFATGAQFKASPFYEALEALGKPLEMPAYPNHRNQVPITFMLSPPNIQRIRDDSTLRILLYCAAKGDTPPGVQSDIAFPPQLEVKVNDQEVKANFKGLKNKAGSTRPADITGFVTKQPNFTNRVLVTYALTQKVGEKPAKEDAQGFTMLAMLVKKRSVDELVSRIARGKIISRERVLAEMQARAKDPDIVVGDSVMSLKDPVSYVRIDVPCRSDVCSHHQCFDAASFLQLQEQAPTWTCPICNKTVSFEGLVVDKYFEDILQKTSKSTYQVTVEANGQWSTSGTENTTGQNGSRYDDTDAESDDDLIEVVKPVKRESIVSNALLGTPFSMAAPTPPRASPMTSVNGSTASAAQRHGSKRKSEVIVISDDDDDEPPAKRPAYSTPNSLPDDQRGRNGYPYPSNPPSFTNRANGPPRFQIGNSGGVGSNDNSAYEFTQEHNSMAGSSRFDDDHLPSIFGNFHTARSGHRPSPLSGTASAPINLLDSPPHRPSSSLAPYSAGLSTTTFGGPGITIPRFPFENFPSPPPIPPSASHTQRANSHHRPEQQSDQRNTLRALANPFGRHAEE